MSAQFDQSDVIRVGCCAKNISDSAATVYWLASHGIDTAFHVADLESQFDQMAEFIATLRRSRQLEAADEQVSA